MLKYFSFYNFEIKLILAVEEQLPIGLDDPRRSTRYSEPLRAVDNELNTPLFGAVCGNHYGVVAFLLGHVSGRETAAAGQRRASGCDVNAENGAKQTALHVACAHGMFDMAEILVRHGALLTIADRAHLTPLAHACGSGGNAELVRYLLEHPRGGARLLNARCLDMALAHKQNKVVEVGFFDKEDSVCL